MLKPSLRVLGRALEISVTVGCHTVKAPEELGVVGSSFGDEDGEIRKTESLLD